MKKKLSIIGGIAACFLLTGCGSKEMTCTYEETTDDGYKIIDTYAITYNDDKVLKVTETATMEVDEEYLDMTLSLGQSITETYKDIEGFEMKLEKVDDKTIKTEVIVDFEKLDLKDYAEKTGAEPTDEFYSNLDITIDEFEKAYLKNYTCK